MLRYYFSKELEITITNDIDITIVQEKNPNTQSFFLNKEEAVAWALSIAQNLGVEIIESEDKIKQLTDVEILQQKITNLEKNNDLLTGCVMELAEAIYS